MTLTQAINAVTFDFKGTGVCCFVCSFTNQMNFLMMHNVAKRLKFVM